MKKGKLKHIRKPDPNEPTKQLVCWEDMLAQVEVTEQVPVEWTKQQVKSHIRSKLIDLDVVNEAVE